MRHVEPQVFLVAEPQLNPAQLSEYLVEVGADWRPLHESEGDRDGELLIEAGGRLCYRSWEPGLNPNVKKIRTDSSEYLENILRSKHGSVMEHAHYSFIFPRRVEGVHPRAGEEQ